MMAFINNRSTGHPMTNDTMTNDKINHNAATGRNIFSLMLRHN